MNIMKFVHMFLVGASTFISFLRITQTFVHVNNRTSNIELWISFLYHLGFDLFGSTWFTTDILNIDILDVHSC
jgi:hypothetical protein